MLKVILILLFSLQINAKVWDSDRSWNDEDLSSFRNWVETKLDRDIFSNTKSPYYGIKTDCADAIFAYMAIYSLENKLYFQAKLNFNNLIDSNSSNFDHLPKKERLKSMVHYIGSNAGTYALAYHNSYPIELKDISGGDIYITEWNKNGKTNRHAYLIKSFQETGHFELYSSTTPAKVRKLGIRTGMPLHNFSKKPWGFKRIAPYYLVSNKRADYSNEQYKYRMTWGKDFLPNLSKYLATQKDNINKNLLRRIGNICDMLLTRVNEVEEAIIYKTKINRCMNSSEYYNYSTPSRDSSLQSSLTRILIGWKKIRKSKLLSDIDEDIISSLDYLLGKRKDIEAKENLYNLCPLKIEGHVFTMRDYFKLKRNSRLSSNPNNSLRSRWGLPAKKSNCPTY